VAHHHGPGRHHPLPLVRGLLFVINSFFSNFQFSIFLIC
jgi:hypothetical protein